MSEDIAENTKKFIELIKERSLLYDSNHEHYNNRYKRAAVWSEIAAITGLESKICIAKWKNLRDAYVKHKKQRELPAEQIYKKYKSWPWASLMTFMDCDNAKRAAQSKQPIESRNSNRTSLFYEVDIPADEDAADQSDIPSRSRKIMKKRDPKDKLLDNSKPEYENKSKIGDVSEINHFLSYAETFKKFPARIKSVLKLEMATIFARYEMQDIEDIDESSTPDSPWNVFSPEEKLSSLGEWNPIKVEPADQETEVFIEPQIYYSERDCESEYNVPCKKRKVDQGDDDPKTPKQSIGDSSNEDSRKMFLLSLLSDVRLMSESEMRVFRKTTVDCIDGIFDGRKKT